MWNTSFKRNTNFWGKNRYLVRKEGTIYFLVLSPVLFSLWLPNILSPCSNPAWSAGYFLSQLTVKCCCLASLSFQNQFHFSTKETKSVTLAYVFLPEVYRNNVIIIIFECTAFPLIFLNVNFFQIKKKKIFNIIIMHKEYFNGHSWAYFNKPI